MKDEGHAIRQRIGKKVRHLRLLRGLSQEQLAELAGSQSKHIGQVERGETNVRIDSLAKIAAGLSVDLSDLTTPATRTNEDGGIWITRDEARVLHTIVDRMKRRRARRKKG